MEQYSDEELLNMLEDLESDLVERKESFSSSVRKKARQAVCAFANDIANRNKPGVLIIGAKDDGSPSKIQITDELLQALCDIKSDGNILPLPVLTVEKRILKNSDMAVITVLPSDMPPVRYDGRVWIRTGPRRDIANEQEERILVEKRRFKNMPYDLFPIPTANIDDLARVIFEAEYLPAAFSQDILETDGRSYEQRLASVRMIVSPEESTPTLFALLTLGKSPQDFVPGAFIQFLRIDGIELEDQVVDEEKISGSIPDMLRAIEQKINAHNRIAVDITSGPKESRFQDYPPVALLQIIYNGVMHRTYEGTNAPIRIYWFNDRIEIHSPGGPYGNVTIDNFGTPGITDYRNPNLANTMKIFGFVQSFGRGIATARKEMEKNGNPPIEFIINQSTVLCILRKHK